ncbi:MAG: hypothetical protein A3K15_09120 [Candidatus Edwardsbacteria bacterium GWE2_54_12]|nr:MAG: hypothetical protein A3K15_09120 [Candidatus Edwardsbacteria bacterium GWE2_54_12]
MFYNLKFLAGGILSALMVYFPARALELQREMEFAPGDVLKIDIKAGNIQITGNHGGAITINAQGDILPEVERSGNTVRIFTDKHQNWNRKRLDLTIGLPSWAAADISSGAGDVAAYDISGGVLIDIGAGDIYARNLSGKLDAETGAGNIQGRWQQKASMPGQCRLTTGVGNINLELPDSAGVRIDAQTGLGKISGRDDRGYGRRADISIGSGEGVFQLSTGIGNISINAKQILINDWPDDDILNWRHQRLGYQKDFHFEMGGGPLAFWPDRSAGRLQPYVSPAGFPELRQESYCWGGQGYMQFNRFRIGYAGWGQDLKARSSLSDTQRYYDYKYSLGGVTLEYVLLRGRRADISLGALLGGVDAEINLARSASSDLGWEQTVLLDSERELALKSEGFMGMPLVRGKLRLFGIVWLQAQAGYLYSRMGEWKTHTEKEVFSTPPADPSGWIFAVGPHFGI